MRVHAIMASSVANGPGRRVVVWTQGCSLACQGCYNPETHSLSGGQETRVEDLAQQIQALSSGLEGFTVSGGEPLQQMEEVSELCRQITATTDLSVLVFTGYARSEVEPMAGIEVLLANVDALITGRFNQSLSQRRVLLGSANQELWLITDRFTEADFAEVPTTEIIITPEGDVVASGIDPVAI